MFATKCDATLVAKCGVTTGTAGGKRHGNDKNIVGNPCMTQRALLEHKAAFVERFLLKRATPALPSPTPAKSLSGLLGNVAGGECPTPLTNNKYQTVLNNLRRLWLTTKNGNQKVQ